MLASHLHLPLQVVMEQTTGDELFEWVAFIRQHRPPEFSYLAQIALEIRRGWAKNPSEYKIPDFLLDFEGKSSPAQDDVDAPDPSKMTKTEQVAYRKKLSQQGLSVWRAVTGFVKPKTSPKKKR